MHVDHVSYGRTYNLGNFRSERIDISATITEVEQEMLSIVYAQLRRKVEEAHKAAEEIRKEEATKVAEEDDQEWRKLEKKGEQE